MTKDIKYRCNLCRDIMGLGYGINWTGPGGGDKINLATDKHDAKNLEHHLCQRCGWQIEAELKRIRESKNNAVEFE